MYVWKLYTNTKLSGGFWLRRLPEVMTNMGFKVAPALMNRWFDAPIYPFNAEEHAGKGVDFESLPPERIEEKLVTTAWARSHDYVETKLDRLVRTWNSQTEKNEDGVSRYDLVREQIEKRLAARMQSVPGLMSANYIDLGDLSLPARQLHGHWQVQFERVGRAKWKMPDEWTLALGDASWYLAVGGVATRNNVDKSKFKVTVTQIATYLYDVYDFFDADPSHSTQPLGVWSRDCVQLPIVTGTHVKLNEFAEKYDSSVLKAMRRFVDLGSYPEIPCSPDSKLDTDDLFCVTNSSYLSYRIDPFNTKKGKSLGGDFYIFSDTIKWGSDCSDGPITFDVNVPVP